MRAFAEITLLLACTAFVGALVLPGRRSLLPSLARINDAASFEVVLASTSPRRRELLQLIGLTNVNVVPSKFKEDLDKSTFRSPADYCAATSRAKAMDLVTSGAVQPSLDKHVLIISADTIVVYGCHDEVLEKPRDEEDARRMLGMLSGKQHTVFTAVTILASPRDTTDVFTASEFVESSQVRFVELGIEDIDSYIASREPFDKSGAYGVQGVGSLFVRSISGCYFNVMGLPLSKLSSEIAKIV